MGIAARADMALLLEVFDVEAALAWLAQPAVEPDLDEEGNVTNRSAVDADEEERAAARAIVSAASEEVLEWVEKRKPVIEKPKIEDAE